MTNRLEPAETYTHTHTHTCNLLLSPKQIGTICFAIFSILISAPLFATGVSSTATSANCDKPTLNTYTGTSNLQADWQPNTIALHWYDGDTELNVPTVSQSCVYDSILTPPTTIPTKTGYTFTGWRVKQAAGCSFASQVCGLNGSEVNGMSYVNYGYKNDSTGLMGAYEKDASRYGLTTDNSWATEFNTGIIKGIASCNSTMPTIMTAMGNGTMTEEQAMAAVYGSCASDAIKPGNTFSSSSSGQYCWCKMESYTPRGGSACNVSSSSWVFLYDNDSADRCAHYCANFCANVVQGNVDFRRAVFGAQ